MSTHLSTHRKGGRYLNGQVRHQANQSEYGHEVIQGVFKALDVVIGGRGQVKLPRAISICKVLNISNQSNLIICQPLLSHALVSTTSLMRTSEMLSVTALQLSFPTMKLFEMLSHIYPCIPGLLESILMKSKETCSSSRMILDFLRTF